MLRTHTCGELNEKDIDKEAVLCGWVHTRRDHGELIFIDLRDRYGLTQIVFNSKKNRDLHTEAHELKSEFVISVRGIVGLRPKGTENLKIPTGKIEVAVKSFETLSASKTPPFEIEDNSKATEDTRLSYRYLDMRRPSVRKRMELRHKILKKMRDYLDKEGFLEIETPILTKSTPEGARDFLVPSRLTPGTFFALPQSPQLFKQILMVAGIDKYFQIARCFRDEDLRADRQPEFTQLDIEASFVEEEDIYSLCEGLMKRLYKEISNIDISTPFKRMTYKEAMEKFGTDKPDLKEGKSPSLLWVYDFPLFKYNEEEKRWEAEHHPFTAPKDSDLSRIDSSKDMESVKARAYDLVIDGAEVASGSIRIHDGEIQQKLFDIIGIGKNEAQERFGFLLQAFQYGVPPHGGIAFGLDRLITLFTKDSSIREVMPFPKTQKGVCPLTGAPSSVSDKQLKELNLKLRK